MINAAHTFTVFLRIAALKPIEHDSIGSAKRCAQLKLYLLLADIDIYYADASLVARDK